MGEYNLKIVTPDGILFSGKAKSVIVRTIAGDVCILENHANYVSPLKTGRAKITDADGNVREAAVSGGMISVTKEQATIVSKTFEWKDEIDIKRAEKALKKAEDKLKSFKKTDREYALAKLKIERALTRINVGKK